MSHAPGTEPSPSGTVAALHVRRSPEWFLPTIRSIRAALGSVPLAISAPSDEILEPLADFAEDTLVAGTLATTVNRLARAGASDVLAIDDAVLLPPDFLGPALAVLRSDLRIATVSFLCNSAGYASFPNWRRPWTHQIEQYDEQSLTRRLREVSPATSPTPVPFVTGAAVLISSSVLSAIGPLQEADGDRIEAFVADLSLRSRGRGFVDLLDTSTFYARPSDLSVGNPDTFLDPVEVDRLADRSPGAAVLVDVERVHPESPFGRHHRLARAKALGLEVLIDGSMLGPKEMGTQVQLVEIVRALSARDDVARVAVALPGPIPAYARDVLSHPRVQARPCGPNDFSQFGTVDVAHRPFQPTAGFDPEAFGAHAHRTVVSMLDVIAYQIPNYHASVAEWDAARFAVQRAVSRADAVTVISDDAGHWVRQEGLPVDDERLFTVLLGVDHLEGVEEERIPQELLRRNFAATRFLLVLGANYGHKNRDLALAAHRELLGRGHDVAIVCVGAQVPHGSARAAESKVLLDLDAGGHTGSQFLLADVDSDERNWLLGHAELVLYPTAAEGFGLVPFEAARFGTPTVHVEFGSLAELTAPLPVQSDDWSPARMADAAESLLMDPGAAAAQVDAVLAAGTRLTWASTAEHLTRVYREVLVRPPRTSLLAADPVTTASTDAMPDPAARPRGAELVESLDRLSLEQALRDFEIANARVIDLTRRLTTMNGELTDALVANAALQREVTRLSAIQRGRFYAIYRVLRGGKRMVAPMLGRSRAT